MSYVRCLCRLLTQSTRVIQHIGAASTVLLKNINGTLPLRKPRNIALIGSDLGPSHEGPDGYTDRGGDDGTLAMGWGSGTDNFPYLVDLLQAIHLPARHDHTSLSWWFNDFDTAGAAETATGIEVAIVGINSDSGEDYIVVDGNEGDRNNITAWHGGDDLVLAVAAVNNNTIVVVHSVGPLIIEPWIDHPNVTAVLWAGIPGQESGNSLVDVLYGAYNPSGRLPYTIAKSSTDYSAEVVYVDAQTANSLQINYTEGLNIDYRHFLSANITPRYEFGYGLSYTNFNFTNLQIWDVNYNKTKRSDRDFEENGNRTVGAFLLHSLQMPRWTVTADIQNVGSVDGCEIPQLYLSYPPSAGEPPRVLRDFVRINLEPWQAEKVYFNLSKYDVSIWDVKQQTWTIPEGEFGVVVAESSMDVGLTGRFCPSGKC